MKARIKDKRLNGLFIGGLGRLACGFIWHEEEEVEMSRTLPVRVRRHCQLTTIMSSHSYEVALFGEFFSQDLKPILNRITLHSDSSQQIHTREIVFEPLDAHIQRDSAVLLRAKKELSQQNSTWYTFSIIVRITILFHRSNSGNSSLI